MIKSNIGWSALLITFLVGFISCEQEDRFVGATVLGDEAANLHKAYVDVDATTLLPDTIRSDRGVLQNAAIGVYDEPLFGKTKSYFYSQVRLGTVNPDFGENAIVDSVVMFIPVFVQTTDTIEIDRYLDETEYTLSNITDGECTISDTVSYYNKAYKFEMDSIYGNRSANMTLQVHRVIDDLKTIDSLKYSNDAPQVGELFGSTQIDDKVWQQMRIMKNTLGAENDSTVVSQTSAGIRFKLEGMRDFVQQNLVSQQGSANLGDQISFINNVLRGVRIGVSDENGFIFNINPAAISLNAYISSDNETFVDVNNNGIDDTEEDCPVQTIDAKKSSTLNLIVGSSIATDSGSKFYNSAHSYIVNEPGSAVYNLENAAVNYLDGMAGAKIKLSLNAEQIEAIRDSVQNNNWVISEAHFKVYPDENTQGSLPLPDYLHAYNLTEGTLLPDYGNTSETDFQGFPYAQISRPYSENGYYLLRVTEFIKNIIEDNDPVDDLAIEIGTYLGVTSTDYLYTPKDAFYSNRVYNPYRLAVVGNNPNASNTDKKLQLEIFYNKRNN